MLGEVARENGKLTQGIQKPVSADGCPMRSRRDELARLAASVARGAYRQERLDRL